jgi:Uma2 family endonuclease
MEAMPAATTTVSEEILAKLFGDNENDERYELVDGVLEAKPRASIFHSMTMSWLSFLLKAEDGEPWKYIMPGHWPQLCVEIVSVPDQTTEEMLDKCKLYHEQGVPFCWVVEPESRTTWKFHAGEASVWVPGSEVLEAGAIRVPVAEIWRGLKNKRDEP